MYVLFSSFSLSKFHSVVVYCGLLHSISHLSGFQLFFWAKTFLLSVFFSPFQWTLANNRKNLISISPETRVPITYIFAADSMGLLWVYRHSDFRSGLRKTHALCNRLRNGRLKSSKVVDFGTNRKSVCDFLFVINSIFGPILHRFWDIATSWPKTPIFPTSPSQPN